jgi:hypothetical protein
MRGQGQGSGSIPPRSTGRSQPNQAVERTGHTTGFFRMRVSVACGPPLTAGVRLLICTLVCRLLACASMDFEIVGDITSMETMASGSGVRERAWLRRQYGQGRWRKRKGVARVRLVDGTLRLAEIHWYEARGIGRREFKLKLPFLDARR